ncbi:MAG: SMP-30/gluconolactonase/LRE family protein [Nonomuraea sp.]|nr:SMP-30/gluconolactonase/LRE family protein [Nonomuraea sp.]
MRAERLATGLAWPEGPSVLADGSVAFVQTYRSEVSVLVPGAGVRRYAFTGGGPNATAPGARGRLFVTQNGGVVGPWRAEARREPCVQVIDAAGHVETFAATAGGRPMRAPNDLAFGADGRLYVTDPGRFDPVERPDPGFVYALTPDGDAEVIAELGPVYPNGIIAAPDGDGVIWTESYTRRVVRRAADGTITTLHTFPDPRALVDGLCAAADGTLFVTGVGSGSVHVLTAAGVEHDRLGGPTAPTNCAFDGPALYVTDGGRLGDSTTAHYGGALWRLTGVPGAQGAGLQPGF